jgi:hypothetical protein
MQIFSAFQLNMCKNCVEILNFEENEGASHYISKELFKTNIT